MSNEKITKENKILYAYLVKVLMNHFIKYAIERYQYFNEIKYYENIQFAEAFRDKLDNFYINFLNRFISIDKLKNIIETEMAIIKINDLLDNIRYHCFKYKNYSNDISKSIYIMRTLEQQNEFARKYIHFDYSSQKPKSFKDI